MGIIRSGIVIAVLLGCAFGAAAQTSVYRWIDKDGKVHFGDTPPGADAKDVARTRVGNVPVDPDLPYATQVAARRSPVTLYVAAGCGEPCKSARDLLGQRGIPYGLRDPLVNAADAEALTKLAGKLEIPVIVVGNTHIRGFEEGQWQSALDEAGYPKALPPGARAPAPTPAVPDPQPAASTPPAPEAAK